MDRIKYKSGYKYQLVESYSLYVYIFPKEDIHTEYIDLNTAGLLIIKSGYASDGPSGPTIDTKSSMRGAFVHDALYPLMRMELLPLDCRKQADKELRRICIEDKMWEWRANSWYKSVRKMAEGSALPENKKEIHVAP